MSLIFLKAQKNITSTDQQIYHIKSGLSGQGRTMERAGSREPTDYKKFTN